MGSGRQALYATLSREVGRRCVDVTGAQDVAVSAAPAGGPVRVDLGIAYFAARSTGETFDTSRPLVRTLCETRRPQHAVARS